MRDTDEDFASSVPSTDSNARATRCIACRESIKQGARKCHHCDSFQDWRGRLNFTSSVLALLVALVSVISLSVPLIHDALTEDNSRVLITPAGVGSDSLLLVASNTGSRPATLSWAELTVGAEAGSPVVTSLDADEPHEIPVFVSESTSILLRLSPSPGDLDDLRKAVRSVGHDVVVLCVLKLEIVDFDGTRRIHSIDLNASTHTTGEGLVGSTCRAFL